MPNLRSSLDTSRIVQPQLGGSGRDKWALVDPVTVSVSTDDPPAESEPPVGGPRRTPRLETGDWELEPVPEPNREQLDRELAQLYPDGYAVRGAEPGTALELGLRYILFRVRPMIGPSMLKNVLVPDLDFAGAVGRVRVSVDAAARPAVELLGLGRPEVNVHFATREEARDRTIRDFRLSAVTDDGRKAWGRRELAKVYAAFTRLPERDREALAGVELFRAESNGTREAPLRIGYFQWSSGIVEGRAEEKTRIALDDRVFASDAWSFAGRDLPASLQTIFHEVGHAVESMDHRRKLLALNRVVAEHNRKADTFNATPAARQAELRPELERLEREIDAARTALAAAAMPDGRSRVLAEFEARVRREGIEPPTSYAATGSPDFFAEGYMFHRTDGDTLARVNPELAAYFTARDRTPERARRAS